MNDIIESARDIDRYPEADQDRAEELIDRLDRSLDDINDRRRDVRSEVVGTVAGSSVVVMLAITVVGMVVLLVGISQSGESPGILTVLSSASLTVLAAWVLTLPLEIWLLARVSRRLRNLRKVIEDKFGAIIRLDSLHEQSDSGEASAETLHRAEECRSREIAAAKRSAYTPTTAIRGLMACLGVMVCSMCMVVTADLSMTARAAFSVVFVISAMAATWIAVSDVQIRRSVRVDESRDR